MNYVPRFFSPFFELYYFFRDRDRLSDKQTEKDTTLLLTTYYVTKLKMLW